MKDVNRHEMDDKAEFGHFYLSLNASQVQSSAKLSHTIAKVESLLLDYEDGFTANAIRNLLGAMHFYHKSPDKSLEHFHKVLEKDESNFNAISNIAFVYKRLMRSNKATETISKLNKASEGDKSEVNKAIRIAEEGFAYLFDCYNNDVKPRWNKCSCKFEDALDVLRKCEDVDRRTQIAIKFWAMQGYQKRYQTDIRNQEKQMETFEKALTLIDYIRNALESDENRYLLDSLTMKNILGVSFAYLGTFFFKDPNTRWNHKGEIEHDKSVIPSVVEKLGFLEEFKNPKICFEKAVKINEQNCEIRIRFANFLKNIKQSPESATEENRQRLKESLVQVEKSLEINNTESNWFGRTTRASVFQTKYRIFGDKSDLEEAIKDWEKADAFNHNSFTYSQLADAHRMMALKDGSRDELDMTKDEYITKSSIYFWKSVQSLGSGKNPETHRSHGRFLRSLGDKREAIECFKRAMEIDTAHKPTKSFEHLFETFLQMYEEELEKIEGDDRINLELRIDRLLFEIAFWFRFAVKRYKLLANDNIVSTAQRPQTITKTQSVIEGPTNVTHSLLREIGTVGLLKRHIQEFIQRYEKGMAHLGAYFSGVMESNSTRISEMIKECVKEDSIDKWTEIVDKWKERRARLSAEKGISSCPTCGGLSAKLSYSEPPEKARNENCKYDFYVVYPESQREWVLYSLLQKLEALYGFKGAIVDRDAIPGSNLLNSITDLIHNSHRVLAILTREFYQDRWCMQSVDQAETFSLQKKKDNFVIPILLEAMDVPDRFSTIICLDVVDYCDWDKLVRSIDRR